MKAKHRVSHILTMVFDVSGVSLSVSRYTYGMDHLVDSLHRISTLACAQ